MISFQISNPLRRVVLISLFVALSFRLVLAAPGPEVQLTRVGSWSNIWAVTVSGTNAYVLDGDFVLVDDVVYWGSHLLKVLDISDPRTPLEVGSVGLQRLSGDLVVAGDLLFVWGTEVGIEIIDVSDPRHPTSLGEFEESQTFADMAVNGSNVYLLGWHKLYVLDTSKERWPVLLSTNASSSYYSRVAASPRLVFVTTALQNAAGVQQVEIIDVSDPKVPTLLNTYRTKDTINDLAVAGDYLYLATESALEVVDIHDPHQPLGVGRFNAPNYGAAHLTVSGSLVYLASGGGGAIDDWDMANNPGSELRVIDVADPATPILANSGPIRDLGGFASLRVSNNQLFLWNDWNMCVYTITRVPRILGAPQLVGNQLRLTFAANSTNVSSFGIEVASPSVNSFSWTSQDAVVKPSAEPGIFEALVAAPETSGIYRVRQSN